MTESSGRDLFIVDNNVSGWTGLRYLERLPRKTWHRVVAFLYQIDRGLPLEALHETLARGCDAGSATLRPSDRQRTAR